MADAVSSFTVQVLLEKALSFATDRVGMVYGFKKDLESLQQSVVMIQAVLLDAEDKQSQSQPVQLWLQRLEEIAYEAYEVLDELNYEILRRKVKSRNQPKGKVCSFYFFSKYHVSIISFRCKMAPKVRDIIVKLKTVNQQAQEFGLTSRMATPLLPAAYTATTAGAAINRETNSIVGPNVVGRDQDESKVVEILLSSTEKVVSVLPIVGMGGLGKTTLAKLVFNHKHIQDHFNKRIWVCVSDKKFDGRRVFKLILEQLGENVQPDSSEDTIVQKIRKRVEGKRYLLVLDDVWNEDPQLWDNFYESLVGLSTMSDRSWCLVTSRRLTTATIVTTHDHHKYSLGKLSDDDCWSILKEKAIASGEAPQELIAIKEQAIQRCAGLPLAAKVLGSLLRVQRKEEWPLIVEKKLSYVIEDHEHNAMPILKLSFDYLPSPSIKKCFAYLSIFEADSEMKGDDLIRLWMAEGFLQPDLRSERTMEKIGDQYLTILLQSSLLEEVEEEVEERVAYKLHDLAKLVSKNETIVLEDGEIDSRHPVRYLALDSFEKIPEKSLIDISTSVRTLFLFLKSGSGISDDILPKFKNLHVLKLSFDDEELEELVELPSSIGKLKHMRYLDISETQIETLPESLCKLYNLQTLIIPTGLKDFPKGMSDLISLRHLLFFSADPKFPMPVEMGRLTCIQTLKFFNVGEGKGRGIEELGFLEKLEGELLIRNLELVKGKEGAIRAKLSGKQNLIDLEFYWGRLEDRQVIHNCDEVVLEGLEPHPNLRELTVENFMGERFPGWFGNLSMLVRLQLKNCMGCIQLPVLGHLPRLEHLFISGLEKVSCIGDSFYGLHDVDGTGGSGESHSGRKLFPALKTLQLERMPNLTEWKEEVAVDCDTVFSVLEELRLNNCGNLMGLPAHLFQLQSLRVFQMRNCSKILRVGPPPSSTKRETNNHPQSLQQFLIGDCNGLTSIARETLECCPSLEQLYVYDCPNLVSFPLDFGQTPNLSEIWLFRCPKLFANNNNNNIMPRGFGHLAQLEELLIGPFADDSSVELFDWSGLISCSSTLRRLVLFGSRDVESLLPNQLQHLTSLKRLELGDFGLLEALPDWLGSLTSLEELSLWNCQKLQRLPSAAAISRLTKLRWIEVFICPLLQKSLREERGPDSEWSKVSHIPDLYYN